MILQLFSAFRREWASFVGTVTPFIDLGYSHFDTSHFADVTESLALGLARCLLSAHAGGA